MENMEEGGGVKKNTARKESCKKAEKEEAKRGPKKEKSNPHLALQPVHTIHVHTQPILVSLWAHHRLLQGFHVTYST